MFVSKPQIKISIPYLQKPIHRMTISDMVDMSEKAARILGPKESTTEKLTGLNQNIIFHEDLSDMFNIKGKLNRKTKRKFRIAIKDGLLPKKALIQDLYYSILNHIAENH